ncbi:hypothetical protein FSP39_012177 [Pinctada imbricata]|uniref:Mitochondria-eating protein n=1 Tax=Pinctada imbricata TaxID=66713 RepID=A0AA88YMH2_PINIB|nr:hypothetical protein FSP39_012177 [Pinctada imbricata]
MMSSYGRYSKSVYPYDTTRSQTYNSSNPLYGIETRRTPSPSLYPSSERWRKTDHKYDTATKHDDLASNTTSTGASGLSTRQEDPSRTRLGGKSESDFSRSLYTKTTATKEGSTDPRSNVRKVLDLVSLIRDVDLEKAMYEYRTMKESSDPSGLTKEDEYQRTSDDTVLSKHPSIPDTSRVEAERDALKMEVEELHKKMTEMTAKMEEVSMKRNQESESENKEIQKLKKQIEESEKRKMTTLEEWKKVLEDYDMKELNMKAEMDALKKQTDKLNSKIRLLERERDVAQREKTDALTRLSKEMGTKLNQKNANIADLSDTNRPTRLAEKYNELYDNEWTDAIEILSSIEEDSAIKILLNIIQTAYQFCEKVADEQLQSLQNQICNPIVKRKEAWTSTSKTLDNTGVSNDLTKILGECRKTMGTDVVDELYREFLAWKSTGKHAMKVEDYSKKCLGLCWLMVIQDPAVVLGKPALSGDPMDLNLYKEYTKTGTSVSFTVWVPLFLYKDGPLLCKGVAQPTPVKTPRRAKTAVDRKSKETTADRPGSRTKSFATSHDQESSDSGLSSTADTQKEVDDMFAIGQRDLGSTYRADMHISHRPYSTETHSQPSRGHNLPRMTYYRNKQYVEYDGRYYTLEDWNELEQRVIRMSETGQSDV